MLDHGALQVQCQGSRAHFRYICFRGGAPSNYFVTPLEKSHNFVLSLPSKSGQGLSKFITAQAVEEKVNGEI